MSEQEIYRRWCEEIMANIEVGGHWIVPRSGLIFRKVDEQTLQPCDVVEPEEQPLDGLIRYQAEDLAEITWQFREAGFIILSPADR